MATIVSQEELNKLKSGEYSIKIKNLITKLRTIGIYNIDISYVVTAGEEYCHVFNSYDELIFIIKKDAFEGIDKKKLTAYEMDKNMCGNYMEKLLNDV